MKNNNYKYSLFGIGVVLFFLSLYFHVQNNYPIYRTLRALVSFVYLGFLFYLHKQKISSLLTIFLSVYGVSSLLSVWYELPQIPALMFGLNLISYISLILYLKPKIKKVKISPIYMGIFLLLAGVNAFLLYQLIQMIREIGYNNTQYIAVLVSSVVFIFLCFMALLYNYTNGTKASLLFLVFLFLLIFSDVFRAIGYYDFAFGDAAVYVARLLLIIATACLIHYSVVNDREKPKKNKNLI